MDKMNIKFSKNVRTDLALEIKEMVNEKEDVEIPGVVVEVTQDKEYDIKVTSVKIENDNGEQIMNKPKGKYITLESPYMKERNMDAHEEITMKLAEELSKIASINTQTKVLIIGLGNREITPDALGPKVVETILVTRHIKEELPKEIDESVSVVSALAPGVMGQTGIETGEIIKGLADKTKPDIVIIIDALASRRTSRVNTTIQITDTGIQPGAGVGNRRMEINENSLGIPVIAIGVPTVVDAATIVNDTIDRILKTLEENNEGKRKIGYLLKDMNDEEKYFLIKEILTPYIGDLFVTPKEIDIVTDSLSNIISNALNIFLHPGLDRKDMNRFLY